MQVVRKKEREFIQQKTIKQVIQLHKKNRPCFAVPNQVSQGDFCEVPLKYSGAINTVRLSVLKHRILINNLYKLLIYRKKIK